MHGARDLAGLSSEMRADHTNLNRSLWETRIASAGGIMHHFHVLDSTCRLSIAAISHYSPDNREVSRLVLEQRAHVAYPLHRTIRSTAELEHTRKVPS